MTALALPAALQACASGILTAEAAVSLLIESGGWLHRDDFTSQFIITATSISDGVALMASIEWQAAITALDDGRLPCSSGERHMLRLAASIAAGIPVSLCDTLTGIDHGNAGLLTTAILHGNGQLPADAGHPRRQPHSAFQRPGAAQGHVRGPVLRSAGSALPHDPPENLTRIGPRNSARSRSEKDP